MKKKGFTLVELLAVIAILAILVIIALPNVMGMFNKAKKGAFETEVKEILKLSKTQWMSDNITSSGETEYSKCESGCTNPLKNMDARKSMEYYVKLNSNGKVVKLYATDGTYQYEYNGEELKADDIKDIKTVADLNKTDVLKITVTGKEDKDEFSIIHFTSNYSPDINTIGFYGRTIINEGEIAVNFYLKLPNGKTASDYPNSYVKISSKASNVGPLYLSNAKYIEEVNMYKFTINHSICELGNKMTPVFYYTESGSNKTVTGDAYAAKDYLDWVLNGEGKKIKNQKPKLYKIFETVADFSYYAMLHFSEQNHWTIGRTYDAQTVHVTDNYDYESVYNVLRQYEKVEEIENGPISRFTIYTDSQYKIKLGIIVDIKSDHTLNKVLLNDKIDQQIIDYGNRKMVSFYINPTDFFTTYTFKFFDSDGSYSLLKTSVPQFLYETYSKKTDNKKANDFCCAFYYYYKACSNYY